MSDALQSEDQMEQPVNKTDEMLIDDLFTEEIDREIETSIIAETSHRFICTFCSKVLSTKANKNYHERICRRPEDDRVNESNSKKRRLNEYTSVQIGGNDANKHPESWENPKLIKSALNQAASIYRKEFDQENRKNLHDRLQAVIRSFKPTIEMLYTQSKQKGMKYYFTLKVIFHQAKNETILTDPPVSFRSEVFTKLHKDSFEKNIQKCLTFLTNNIENFEKNGSGWIIDSFIALDLGMILFH